jgi:ERCC4-related helicase
MKLVVFDEVHHVLKQHPYRALAAALLDSGARPRVLGLSASLTYAVGAKKVELALQKLCR